MNRDMCSNHVADWTLHADVSYPHQRNILDTLSDRVQNQQQQCPLFSQLPDELRLRIYEFAMSVRPDGLDQAVVLRDFASMHRAPNAPSVLSLLATCRRVYVEAAQIFYATHRLQLYLTDYHRPPIQFLEQTSFLDVTSQARLKGVRELVIPIPDHSHMAAACEPLQRLPRLRRLHIVAQDRTGSALSGSAAVDRLFSELPRQSAQMQQVLAGFPSLQSFEVHFPYLQLSQQEQADISGWGPSTLTQSSSQERYLDDVTLR